MTEATDRIIPGGSGFKIEINRPGEVAAIAGGFDAQLWIAEEKRIAALNRHRKSIPLLHLREV